jgi:hypothetical protein
MAHGHGEYYYPDSGSYVGNWKYDYPHGKGEEIYADKSSYNGNSYWAVYLS